MSCSRSSRAAVGGVVVYWLFCATVVGCGASSATDSDDELGRRDAAADESVEVADYFLECGVLDDALACEGMVGVSVQPTYAALDKPIEPGDSDWCRRTQASFSALAWLDDGRREEVTSDAEWLLGDPSVARQSPAQPWVFTAGSRTGSSPVRACYCGFASPLAALAVSFCAGP
jgi:hypothetical protein